MTNPTWSLHPQLAQDATPVGDLALARVLLANDANYPWLILVPRRPSVTEIIDLRFAALPEQCGGRKLEAGTVDPHVRHDTASHRSTPIAQSS